MSFFLSPTEEKIANALRDAAALHSSTERDPNVAVKTAALRHGLNAEMTDRLVESFNIAFLRSHIKTAEEKESAIPLADKGQVFKMLFQDEPLPGMKSAQAPTQESASPTWSFGDSRKVAEAPAAESRGSMMSLDTIPIRVASIAAMDERRVSNLRATKTAALEAAVDAGLALANKFSSSSFRHQFRAFQSEALSVHGSAAIEILDSVRKAASVPDSESLRDPASHAGKFLHRITLQSEVDLVGKILESQRKYASVMEEEALLNDEMDRRGAQLDKVFGGSRKSADSDGGGSRGGGSNPVRDLLSSEYRPSSFSGITRDLLVASDLVDSPSAQAVNEAQIKNLVEDYGDASTRRFKRDRGIEDLGQGDVDEIRSFAQSSVLSDLIANDPIISAASPSDVKDAYASLVRLSPEAAANPSIAKSVLRSTLAGDGAMDPFTADQLAVLQERVMKSRGQLRPVSQD